jgi:hypothetical protein
MPAIDSARFNALLQPGNGSIYTPQNLKVNLRPRSSW